MMSALKRLLHSLLEPWYQCGLCWHIYRPKPFLNCPVCHATYDQLRCHLLDRLVYHIFWPNDIVV